MNHLKSSNSSRAFLSWSLLLAVSFAGMILLFICTSRWGVGASVDSIAYIGGAREIIKGNGYRSQISGSPITQWPPLFSASLALIGFSGIDPLDAARILNSILLGLNMLLVGITLKKFTGSTATALTGSFFIAASHSMALIHGMAWSEPLFIFWCLAAFLYLARYLETESRFFLLASALITAAACFTRYAGISVIGAILPIILFFNPRKFMARLIDFSIFTIVSVLPLVIWFARNHISAGNLTHLDHQFHPPTWDFYASLVPTVTSWFFPPLWPEVIKNAALITISGLTLAGLILNIINSSGVSSFPRKRESNGSPTHFRRRTSSSSRKVLRAESASVKTFGDDSEGTPNPPFRYCLALVFFGIFYFGMLVFHRTFSDVDIKVSLRYMSPLYVTSLLFVLITIHCWLAPYLRHPIVKGLVLGLVALLGIASVANASIIYSKLYARGTQFTSRKWRVAETITKLKSLPPSPIIYSNAPTPIYFLLGQPAKRLPKKYDDEHVTKNQADKPTTGYRYLLEGVLEKLINQKGYVVLFNSNVTVRKKWFDIPLEELKELLYLVPVAELEDGVIYQAAQT